MLHMFGEITMHLHADNCTGQNKKWIHDVLLGIESYIVVACLDNIVILDTQNLHQIGILAIAKQ